MSLGRVIELHIVPALGAKSLAKLRARDLDRLYDKMTAAGSAGGWVLTTFGAW